MHLFCPHCHNPIELVETPKHDVCCPSCGSSFAIAKMPTAMFIPEKGTQTVGRFVLVEALGSGAFGTVYKAHDPKLDRNVAIKMPRPGNVPDGEHGARFLREARSAAQLRHPAIVPIYEVGQVDGVPYLVSELIEGLTLADALAKSKLTSQESGQLLAAIADALDYAHRQGVIHRDLKPSNIMLDAKGEPHVMDFGLAKREAGEITMTVEGQILGTPAYMSPEQARGESGKVDARSDVYSLGVILYQMLTGELPFRGNLRMLLHQVLHDDPRAPGSLNDRIPRDLETICLKAMAKEPEHRYATAALLAADLRRFLNGEPIEARPITRSERIWRWCRHNPTVATTSVMALTGLVFIAFLSVVFGVFQYQAVIEVRGEQKKTADALEDTNRLAASLSKEQKKTSNALAGSRRLSATLALDQGLTYCNKGEVGHGLLWLVRALEIAPADATDLCHVIRVNLAAWRPRLQALQMIMPHPRQIETIAFSPDGLRVVTGGADGKVRIWNLDGKQLAEMAHTDIVNQVVYSPDGKVIVSGSDDHTVRIWDGVTGQPRSKPLKHKELIDSLAISPDSKWAAAGVGDGTAQVWDIATGQPVGKPVAHPSRVTCVCFSPDSKVLVTATGNATVRFWNPTTGMLLREFGHKGGIETFAFSNDGKLFVTGGSGPSAQLWDPETGKPLGPVYPHQNLVRTLAFSPDNKTLVTGSGDKTARLWETTTGKPISVPLVHAASIEKVAFSPDGTRVATASRDGTARLWDAATGDSYGAPLHHETFVAALAFSPNGKSLATACWDGRARLWNAVPPVNDIKELPADGLIQAAAFSPNGKIVAVGGFGNTAKLWNVATGKQIGPSLQHNRMVWALAFTPDSKIILTGADDWHAQLWDTSTGKAIGALLKHPGPVGEVAISPDGNTLATECHDRDGAWTEIRLWNVKTGNPLGAGIKTSQVNTLAFSSDSKVLASGGGTPLAGQAHLWDAVTGAPIGKPIHHDGTVWMVAFSHVGNTLATASLDRTVKLWDAAAEPLRTVEHKASVMTAVFRKHDGALLTASNDRTARLWDAASGKPLGPSMLHPSSVLAAAFSPDGQTILTACDDGAGRLWDSRTGRILGPPLAHKDFVHKIGFSPNGNTVFTSGGDAITRLWPVPQPWNDAPETINLWLEVTTGLALDREHGLIIALDAEAWNKCRDALATDGK